MKALIASLTLVFTSAFECFNILIDIIKSIFRSARNVQDVVEDASETFRMEEKLLNADKIKKLQAELSEKDIEL